VCTRAHRAWEKSLVFDRAGAEREPTRSRDRIAIEQKKKKVFEKKSFDKNKKNWASLTTVVFTSSFGTHETRLLRCSFLFQHK
jgi:hypothetical protein